jgi:hypothetical protein
MSPAQWRAQSLCPDWTVRAVVGHLAGVEQMLAGPAVMDAGRAGQLRLVPGHPRLRLLGARARHHHAYIVGKKVGLPDGSSIVFHLTGPLRRDLYVIVDGRAKVVGHVDRPDVELSTDSVTFVQLACGRIDPQAQIDADLVRWTGNDQLGSLAARNLRYTM